jgi:hypothetical protein
MLTTLLSVIDLNLIWLLDSLEAFLKDSVCILRTKAFCAEGVVLWEMEARHCCCASPHRAVG